MTHAALAAELGATLRRLRLARRLSLGQLGARCGLSAAALSKAETGAQLPTLCTLVRIAGGLRTRPSRLLAAWESLEGRPLP